MNRKRLSLVIAGAMVASSLQTGFVASAQNINTVVQTGTKTVSTSDQSSAEKLMGTINDYGAIVFGNASFTKGDSETPFAIGGNLSAPTEGTTFTLVTANDTQPRGTVVVGQPINMKNKSGLLLGGTLDPNGTSIKGGKIGNLNILAPNVVIDEGGDPYNQLKTSENWNQTKVNYLPKTVIEQKFQTFKDEANQTVKNVKKIVNKGTDPSVKSKVEYIELANDSGTTNIKGINIPQKDITGKKINNIFKCSKYKYKCFDITNCWK